MSINACVKIKFYDDQNNEIRSAILNCPKTRARCKEIKLPKNAKSLIVCFTTERESCENCT